MAVPINGDVAPSRTGPPGPRGAAAAAGATASIGGPALTGLLGRWSAPDGPLYRLLAARLGRLADTGELPPGLRLPAERALAGALSVSRNTVAMAYQVLRDEGMAASRHGSGTRIVPHRTTPAAAHRADGFFSGLLEESAVDADLTVTAVECAPQVAAALDDPASVLGAAERRAVTAGPGCHPLGLPALRDAIARLLTARHGVPTTPRQVIVTTGAQQALDLLIRCEVLPGQPAAAEDPTYPGVLDALHRAAARVIGLPAAGGTDPGRVEHALRTHRPALVYLVPTHHNPTGRVMPEPDRRRVAALAAAHPDTIFVDDLALAELALAGGPAPGGPGRTPPPLAALAPRQPNVITVGSLGKLYWGGLRTGWIRAPEGIIARIGAAKAAADLGSTAYQQAVVGAVLDGQHDGIVRWRGEWIRARYDALAAALRAHLPGWAWTPPEGGLTLWARLPGQADGGAFAQAALRHGVAVVPGRLLSPASQQRGYVRLAYTGPPARLAAAAAVLARVQGAADGRR